MEKDKVTAELVDRKDGYYWVKYSGSFIIAEYFNGYWFTFGDEDVINDSDFEEIDERQICRS